MSLRILSSIHDNSQMMKTFIHLMMRTLISGVSCVEAMKGKKSRYETYAWTEIERTTWGSHLMILPWCAEGTGGKTIQNPDHVLSWKTEEAVSDLGPSPISCPPAKVCSKSQV